MVKQKTTSLEYLMPVFRERLENGQSVQFMPQGTSMLPMIRQGVDSVVVSPVSGPLKRYDLPLYQRDNGQYVLHRVVGVEYGAAGDPDTAGLENRGGRISDGGAAGHDAAGDQPAGCGSDATGDSEAGACGSDGAPDHLAGCGSDAAATCTYTCMGDNQFVLEPGLRHDQMIGVVTEFYRGGRRCSVNSLGYKIYCRAWYRSRHARHFWRRAVRMLLRLLVG